GHGRAAQPQPLGQGGPGPVGEGAGQPRRRITVRHGARLQERWPTPPYPSRRRWRERMRRREGDTPARLADAEADAGRRGRVAMGSRALVLGGGGPVGIAWESGLLAGLAKAGVDLGKADFILGTSAGSFVGARLAMGAVTAELADAIVADAESPVRPMNRGGRPPPDLSKLMRLMAAAQAPGADPE